MKNKMTQLKTLKDIYGKKRSDRRISRVSLIEDFKQDLKSEAVKWLRNYKRTSPNELAIQDFIKHFFNIEGGDLK